MSYFKQWAEYYLSSLNKCFANIMPIFFSWVFISYNNRCIFDVVRLLFCKSMSKMHVTFLCYNCRNCSYCKNSFIFEYNSLNWTCNIKKIFNQSNFRIFNKFVKIPCKNRLLNCSTWKYPSKNSKKQQEKRSHQKKRIACGNGKNSKKTTKQLENTTIIALFSNLCFQWWQCVLSIVSFSFFVFSPLFLTLLLFLSFLDLFVMSLLWSFLIIPFFFVFYL